MNIGGKIQKFAIACAIMGCLVSVIIASVCWAVVHGIGIWLGFVVLICGCLFFLVNALLIYGFGELIIQTSIAADGVQNLQAKFAHLVRQNSEALQNAQQSVGQCQQKPFFEIENGILKKYHGKAPNVRIPDGVTSIGEYAFKDCSGLTAVTIPDGVTSIGQGAFIRCVNLTSVTIPDSVTSIGHSAFSCCFGMTSITIPESITAIEESTFFRCKGLMSIAIPEGVTSIKYHAFDECGRMETVFFAEPCGWERDGTPIDEKILSDPKSAAKYIKNIGEGSIARKK